MGYIDRIGQSGPKRLLAIDGGGIRGVIALEILDRLQNDLREVTGNTDLVLSDVFDYIAGTSTGAIIAAGLALGHSTERLLALYVEQGAAMFDRASLLKRHKHTYEADALEEILRREIGAETTLGDDALKTLLMIVLRNASTDSPWPLSNNPNATFNDRSLPDCNLDLPLWQLVRASTAAPTYFEPETIRVGGSDYVFVDGGVTPFNNPAFQLFTMATLPAYGLNWPTGTENMVLVSVGTGNSEFARPDLEADSMNLLYHATSTPGALMISAASQQDLLCRMMGRCLAGEPLDAEVGDLHGGSGFLDDPLFTYFRYDLPISQESLTELGLGHVRLGDIMAIDRVDQISPMREFGRAVAERMVDRSHLRHLSDSHETG